MKVWSVFQTGSWCMFSQALSFLVCVKILKKTTLTICVLKAFLCSSFIVWRNNGTATTFHFQRWCWWFSCYQWRRHVKLQPRIWFLVFTTDCDLRRHQPLSLVDQDALHARALTPRTHPLVTLQLWDDTVIAAASATRSFAFIVVSLPLTLYFIHYYSKCFVLDVKLKHKRPPRLMRRV